MKQWVVSNFDKDNAKRISADFGIGIIPAVLLDAMHFESDEEIERFLSDDIEFTDPYLMADMDLAVERITQAINNFERICVYGDYDADGVTSTALLYSYLSGIGADVMYYIPARDTEGYGLNNGAVDIIRENGVKLIITVDNGVSAAQQVDYANSLGIDTVITDHHSLPDTLPKAVAIVNPHRADDTSPFKEFSGVGIAFKLVMALEDAEPEAQELLERFSDIAAIGTIGDVVSLTGENRLLVRAGLKSINAGGRLGIEKLRAVSGTIDRELTAVGTAFSLVPRINAGGRLGLSQKSVKLLLTQDEEEATIVAAELNQDNANRKEIEADIVKSAEEILDSDPYLKYQRIIVVAGEDWHQGVIGIAAARIKEKYGKPTIIISYSGENAKGSARSIEGFPMNEGVDYCKELLTIYGGHPMAAGFSLPTENIDAFREKINEYARSLKNTFFPVQSIACKLNAAGITVEAIEDLSLLEPFGSGNPEPVFGLYDMTITGIAPLSGGKHLRLTLNRKGATVEALYFRMTPQDMPYMRGDVVNIAVTLEPNEYNNVKRVSLIIKEITFAKQDNKALLESMMYYDDLMAEQPVTDKMKRELKVTRDDCAAVYRFLKANFGFKYGAEHLLHRVKQNGLTLGKLMVILTAMRELNLITMEETSSMLNIKVRENPQRVNLLSAPILQKLS